MEFPSILFFIVLFPFVFGVQHRYKVIIENFTVEYWDDKYIDASAGISKVNNVNAVNVNFTMKINPENVKCLVKAYNADVNLPLVQFEKSLKDVVEMEMFDMQSVWIRHATPPVVWPLKKYVTYRISRWIPDSTTFPPNLPEGKWKVQITERFINKTRIVAYTMLAKTEYHK